MKALLINLALFLAIATQAQLTEMAAPSMVSFHIGGYTEFMGAEVNLYRLVKDGDTSYTIKYTVYNSSKDITKHSITFKETGGTLSSLYSIWASFFNHENKKDEKYSKTFMLGDQEITCKNYRPSIYVRTPTGYFNMKEKQLDKLFGK